jgi:hypothetical protein
MRHASAWYRAGAVNLAVRCDIFRYCIYRAARVSSNLKACRQRKSHLAASLVALGRHDRALGTVRACGEVLPDITVADLDRVPLKDAAKMEELRSRLREAGFGG